MARCQQHMDLKERVDRMDAEIEIVKTGVTVMKTRFEDIGGGIRMSVAILAIAQVLGTAILFIFKH